MYVLLYTYVVSRNFGMMPCCHDASRVVVESQKALSEVPPLPKASAEVQGADKRNPKSLARLKWAKRTERERMPRENLAHRRIFSRSSLRMPSMPRNGKERSTGARGSRGSQLNPLDRRVVAVVSIY